VQLYLNSVVPHVECHGWWSCQSQWEYQKQVEGFLSFGYISHPQFSNNPNSGNSDHFSNKKRSSVDYLTIEKIVDIFRIRFKKKLILNIR